MALHNPNNWHWVSKNALDWTRTWFEEKLVGTSVEGNGAAAKISKVVSADGDVDVSQRKGKVITIYEVRLVLEFSGSAPEADDVSGTITFPELDHDNTADGDAAVEIDLHSSSKEKLPVEELVKTKLMHSVREQLQKLTSDLISEHGKDIQHAPGSNPASGFSTPKYHAPTGPKTAQKEPATQNNKGSVVNTTTVTDSDEFRTTAEQLYLTFTDPQRLAAFTRAPPKKFEGAQKGGKFELFDGNVSGEFVELEPTKIVQTWRLNQWPEGHFSKQTIEFDQNNVDGVTVMRVNWTGVPVGQEEVARRNWSEYYVRSIKQTFGFGTIL